MDMFDQSPLLLHRSDVCELLEVNPRKLTRMNFRTVHFWPGSKGRWLKHDVAHVLHRSMVMPRLPALLTRNEFLKTTGLDDEQLVWCLTVGCLWRYGPTAYYRFHVEMLARGEWWGDIDLSKRPEFSWLALPTLPV